MSVSATRGESRRQAVHVSVRSSLIFIPRKAIHYSASSTSRVVTSRTQPAPRYASSNPHLIEEERGLTRRRPQSK